MNTTIADNMIDESPNQVLEYKKGIRQCLAAMDDIQQQMENDQREIERLQLETRNILAQISAAK
jgi:hypothetical protein